MITYSVIPKSQLESAHRTDAEYFQPEYLKVENKLDSIKTTTVEEISDSVISFGAYSLCNYIEWRETGVPYLNVENIKDGYIDFEDVKFIDNEVNETLKKSKVKEGDVIITMAGTIGNVAVAHNIPSKVNSNQATAKIILKKDFSPYYLTAFLNSYFGKKQTEREIVSSVQPNIFLWQIKNLKVPIVSKDKEKDIEQIYKRGLDTLEQSKVFYSQAETLLLEELGLKDFKPEEDLSYVVNLSDTESTHRIDAEYFQPKYEKTISKIKSQKSKLLGLLPLSDICSIRRGDFIDPNYYVEKSRRAYIRIKELPAKGDINIEVITYIDDSFSGQNLETLLEGDFVFAGIGATLGKVARISKDLEGSFYSNNTARFRTRKEWRDKVDTCYLQVVLQSIVCQRQFEQRQAQTAQAKIADEELKTVLIPILPKSTQQKIADLVRKSHEARKKAKELLEQAKRKVEELIERRNA